MPRFDLAIVVIDELVSRIGGCPFRIELDVAGLLVEAQLVERNVGRNVDAVRPNAEGVLNLLQWLVGGELLEDFARFHSQGGQMLDQRPVLLFRFDLREKCVGLRRQLALVEVEQLVAKREVSDGRRVYGGTDPLTLGLQ